MAVDLLGLMSALYDIALDNAAVVVVAVALAVARSVLRIPSDVS